MKVVLANGTEVAITGVHAQQVTYQGVLRDCLIFLFEPETIGADAVSNLFCANNCSVIKIEDDEGEYLHSNYTIQLEAGRGYKDIALYGTMAGSEQAGNAMSQRVYVKMAQSTLAERKLEQQQEVLDALLVAQLEG